jgi:membrane-anchored protein YejM (alkaline phosphatase superfamily)
VVLITVDTMRADSLPCFGGARETTPEICALAQKGRVYERAYSPAPATLPALTAIFTHSQASNEAPSDLVAHYDGQTTLAESLSARGLATAAFTDHHGLGHSVAVPVFPPALIQRGFRVFENFGEDRRGRGASAVSDAAIAWLGENGAEPFFLWVHYFDPHFNYRPAPEVEGRFGFTAGACGRVQNGMDITEIRALEKDLSDKEVQCLVALHEAELHATDAQVGRLLAAMDALDLSSKTRVIVAADHGEEFRDRNRVGHEWTVYDELVHVPMLVVGPGIPPSREARVVSSMELHSLAMGAPVALDGEVFTRSYHYYGKTEDVSEVRQRPNEFALITEREKLIVHPDGRIEMFDLTVDPGERTDLASTKVQADSPGGLPGDGVSPLAESLRGRLESRMTELTVPSILPSAGAQARDEQSRERLRALGYVE